MRLKKVLHEVGEVQNSLAEMQTGFKDLRTVSLMRGLLCVSVTISITISITHAR